jgi:hypothetical protein
MNYALMNTPAIENNNLFNMINFNIDSNGGKGIFLNSRLVNIPKLNLSKVYELRNTFDGTKILDGGINNDYTVDLSNAKITEAMFKDSTAFRHINILNNNNLSVANCMFKDNNQIVKVNANAVSNLIEGHGLFSGCESLQEISESFNFTNVEFADNVFLNCKSLNTFYNIGLQNAKITSGVYQGCNLLNDISNVSGGGNLQLNNSVNINNLFKNCVTMLNINNIKIILPTGKDIQADNTFNGCVKLINPIPFNNYNYIVSSTCMYNNCGSLINVTNNMNNSKNTSGMYKDCSGMISYTEGVNHSKVSSAKFENCTNMSNGSFYAGESLFTANMFKKCTKLTNQNITTLNGGSCKLSKDVSGMFEDCANLTSTPSIFDSSNAESLVGTFKGCHKLQSVDVNLNNAKNANAMVDNCRSLTNLNLTIDSTKSFTQFPNLNLRGTSISIDNFVDIASKLPDMSKYIGNSTNYASGLTWTAVPGPYYFQKVIIGYEVESTMFYSNTFKLIPGEYKIRTNRNKNDAIAIIKMDVTTNKPICAMNSLIYSNGFTDEFTVMIDEDAYYCIYSSCTDSTDPNTNNLSLTWYMPYYIIDIRNTPADDMSSTNVQTAMNTLNNKGWQVKANSLVATMSLFNMTKVEPTKSNYLEDVKYVEEELELENINIENEYYMHNDEPKIFITEVFEVPAGYYNLYSDFNESDNFIVYKVTNIGEYPIAISYDNEYSICFDLFENSAIKIKYKSTTHDLILKKL